MRILIHDFSGHAFTVQLSRELARRGNRVRHLYCESFQSPRGKLQRTATDPETFEVEGVSLGEPIAKYSFVKRRGQERRYGRLIASAIERFDPDIVLSANTPPDAQQLILRASRSQGARFVFWLQDIYGEAVGRVLRKRLPLLWRPIAAYYKRLEQGMLARSDHVVMISDDFRIAIDWKRTKRERVHVIENWAALEEIPPRPKDNPWSRAHGLHDKLCLLYSGTLGFKHNPDLLLQVALALRDNPDARVVVVSSGIGADWLREKSAEHGLDNLVVYDFQPFEVLPDVLGSADLLMAILEPDAGVFSVPSKVLSYLCAGRALLLAVPTDNLAAKIVERTGAGRVVDPLDTTAFVGAAIELASDAAMREECGSRGRAYAEATFPIDRVADRFEEILRAR